MESSAAASRVPEMDTIVSVLPSVWTPRSPGRRHDIRRSMRSSGSGGPCGKAIRVLVDSIQVEVRVTLQRSAWRHAMLFQEPLHTARPVLIVRDTRRVVASLGGGQPPPLAPSAFKATPNRALLDALLDLTFEAVKLKRSP